jgi:hypothetical protein
VHTPRIHYRFKREITSFHNRCLTAREKTARRFRLWKQASLLATRRFKIEMSPLFENSARTMFFYGPLFQEARKTNRFLFSSKAKRCQA